MPDEAPKNPTPTTPPQEGEKKEIKLLPFQRELFDRIKADEASGGIGQGPFEGLTEERALVFTERDLWAYDTIAKRKLTSAELQEYRQDILAAGVAAKAEEKSEPWARFEMIAFVHNRINAYSKAEMQAEDMASFPAEMLDELFASADFQGKNLHPEECLFQREITLWERLRGKQKPPLGEEDVVAYQKSLLNRDGKFEETVFGNSARLAFSEFLRKQMLASVMFDGEEPIRVEEITDTRNRTKLTGDL